MTHFRVMLLVWLLASAVPSAGQSPAASHDPTSPGPSLWLRGPFGRVAGLPPAVAAAPGADVLDAFVMDAPLVLEAGEETAWVQGFTVTARPLDGAEGEEQLSVDELTFTGPSEAGRYLVVVEVVAQDSSTSASAWLLDVPDRAAPADGFLDIPAPDVIVEGERGSAVGWPGHGCYAYLCVDVGLPPPAAGLPALPVAPGEVLGARLSDGSGIIAWKGTLRPVPGQAGVSRSANGAVTDEATTLISLVGLEAPASGTWLLALEVEFDRERGWLRTHYRVEPGVDP